MVVSEPFFVFLSDTRYEAGDLLSGVVLLDIEAPLAYKDILVTIKGVATAEFVIAHRQDITAGVEQVSSVVYKTETAKEEVYSANVVVSTVGPEGLSPGVHRFTFSHLLPNSLPASVELPR